MAGLQEKVVSQRNKTAESHLQLLVCHFLAARILEGLHPAKAPPAQFQQMEAGLRTRQEKGHPQKSECVFQPFPHHTNVSVLFTVPGVELKR